MRGVTDEKSAEKNQLRTGKVELRTTFQPQQGGGREGRWSRDKEKGFLYLSNPKCSPKCNPKCSTRGMKSGIFYKGKPKLRKAT